MIDEEIRRQFDEQIRGWTLTDDFLELTDIIERSAAWLQARGGSRLLDERQQATVRAMIERQMELAMRAMVPQQETHH